MPITFAWSRKTSKSRFRYGIVSWHVGQSVSKKTSSAGLPAASSGNDQRLPRSPESEKVAALSPMSNITEPFLVFLYRRMDQLEAIAFPLVEEESLSFCLN